MLEFTGMYHNAVSCEWFALCTNTTTEAAAHPVLGPVPICTECAAKMGIDPDYDIAEA